MVDHRHRGDGVPLVADHHKGDVPRGKDLVLGKAAREQVGALDFPAFEQPFLNAQSADLLAGLDQPGGDDGILVGSQHGGPDFFGALVDDGAFVAGGQCQQHGGQQQPRQQGGPAYRLVAPYPAQKGEDRTENTLQHGYILLNQKDGPLRSAAPRRRALRGHAESTRRGIQKPGTGGHQATPVSSARLK